MGSTSGGGDRPGHNRPIPQQAMRNIETQLQQHMDREQQRRREREENLRQDPWELTAQGGKGVRGRDDSLSCMTESMYSNTMEEFMPFDAHVTEEEKQTLAVRSPDGGHLGQPRPSSRGSIFDRYRQDSFEQLSDIELKGGVGLQQLSLSDQSPLLPASSNTQWRLRSGGGGEGGRLEDVAEACRYSLTVGGVTCALLEANPVHTHPSSGASTKTGSHPSSSSSSPVFCSLDESGLDPVKYFSAVGGVLRGGVTRALVLGHQEQLGHILPADHLL